MVQYSSFLSVFLKNCQKFIILAFINLLIDNFMNHPEVISSFASLNIDLFALLAINSKLKVSVSYFTFHSAGNNRISPFIKLIP